MSSQQIIPRIELVDVTAITGTRENRVTVSLLVGGVRRVDEQESDEGPVDAVAIAIRALVPHEAKLTKFEIHGMTGGTAAVGRVEVALCQDGMMFEATSDDGNIVVASARAYIAALNKLGDHQRSRSNREIGSVS